MTYTEFICLKENLSHDNCEVAVAYFLLDIHISFNIF